MNEKNSLGLNKSFLDLNNPFELFEKWFEEAKKKDQKIIEAISISSYDKKNSIVDSRFVNLKYVINDEWDNIDKCFFINLINY